MTDPQLEITKAFYTALTTPELLLEQEEFPVYSYAPNAAKQYVLISQATVKQAAGTTGCREYSCTILLTIFTYFPQHGIVSELPSLQISEKIMNRLVDNRLDVGEFTMSPIELQLANSLLDYNNTDTYVNRYLRFKFSVYQ